jgi:hypothetical protein
VLVRLALRRFGYEGPAGTFWFCAMALVGGTVIYMALDNVAGGDQTAERRTIEARAAELTARALTPGSPLGCLDAVENALVENACEKSLFASAEAVAAAVAYVDARLSLLPASASLARRDPTYRPSYERLRRGLEADRYGVVAHVLTTRGCNVADCPEIHLLGDSPRVLANIKDHAFEAALGVHALGWANGAVASAQPIAPSMALPSATTGVGPPMASTAPAAPAAPVVASPKFDFPSASSIPPISIMNPEPGPPANSEGTKPASAPSPAAAPLPSKRQAVMSRKPNTHEAAAPQSPAASSAATQRAPSLAAAPVFPPPPQPPVQITPPEPASAPDEPDTHATH